MPKPRVFLAAAVVASLAAAPAAHAAPKKVTYQLTVTGNQVTTWDYHKRQKPDCDWPEEGHGDQEINFYTRDRKPVKVTVAAARGGGVTISPNPLKLEAYADINAEWKRLFTRQSACPGGGVFGGVDGGPPKDEIGSDNCLTSGGVDVRLTATRSALSLAGAPAWLDADIDSYRSLAALCGQQGHPNAVLGLGDTRGEYLGALIDSSEKLSAKKLLDPRTKKLKVSGDASVSYPNPQQPVQPNDQTTGKTTLSWNATFKRVGR
jgi:hypothetical protein